MKEVDTANASNVLFKKYTAAVSALFILTSVSTLPAHAEDMYAYQLTGSALEASLLTDSEGYLTKMNPQTSIGDRSSMNDRLIHTVVSGETLSTIAESYGLKTSTLLWENGLSNAHTLRSGQQLSVPPVDGVSHTVASGESLEGIATKYSANVEAIKKQNTLIADIKTGDTVFIPGGEALVEIAPRTTPARVGTSSRVAAVPVAAHVDLADSSSTPIAGKTLIFPTRGKISQGFRRGHYAFDIADRSKPPIWAASSGKVIKASSGTWGGGYGNHVIIDHGNGLQTLYAHMDYLDVENGQVVDQGQVLGRMGNTGRVYGATGIHLHFEVIKDGVKQVPSNYY